MSEKGGVTTRATLVEARWADGGLAVNAVGVKRTRARLAIPHSKE